MSKTFSNLFRSPRVYLAAALLIAGQARPGSAATLAASTGRQGDDFGTGASTSGNASLVGAFAVNDARGAAYYFPGLGSQNKNGGLYTQSVTLLASDARPRDILGTCSLSGRNGLVGAQFYNTGNRTGVFDSGAAYFYRNLDTAVGTITESAQLLASDGRDKDRFGGTVSLDGNVALVGAQGDGSPELDNVGAAYLFRHLDTASGIVTEDAKLVASDASYKDGFGTVSLSGTTALIGASSASIDGTSEGFFAGQAYLYRNLDTATGRVTENARLQASDAKLSQDNTGFGSSVSLDGNNALVAAYFSGSAYLFRHLDSASGIVTETAQLRTPDTSGFNYSTSQVSLSGDNGLFYYPSSKIPNKKSLQGSVYLFTSLRTATGVVQPALQMYASDYGNRLYSYFGYSISLAGDTFVIGAYGADGVEVDSGQAYTGSVSSLTTLDSGSTLTIDGFSFVSQKDWIIGQSTSSNKVTLEAADTATVEPPRAVYIGQSAGANGNTLEIRGNLQASTVYIGSVSGSVSNELHLDYNARFTIGALRLANGNRLFIDGTELDGNELKSYLGQTKLQVFQNGQWVTVTGANFASSVTVTSTSRSTTIVPK